MSIKVAVTGVNARPDNPGPGLAVARCLRESGCCDRIVGLTYDALDPGLYLRKYCDSAYLLPYPSAGEETLLTRLEAIQERESIDILIPCLDAELMSMARLREEIEKMGISMLLPTPQQLKMRNKDRLMELAELSGIATPACVNVTSAGFFYNCHRDGWQYPLMVKGIFYDAAIARNADEGAAIFHRIAAEWGLPVLVQRFVSGEEVNLTAIGDGEGAMLGAVMMKKRALTAKGKAWAGISIHDEVLEEGARNLVKTLSWPGPLEVEVMRDPEGKHHLIEINPRFPAWIYLSHGVGRNLPAVLVSLALGKEPAQMPPPDLGVLFIRYAEEQIVPIKDFETVVMEGSRTAATREQGGRREP